MEQMIDGTKLGIEDLLQMIGALYVENATLKQKIELLMEDQKEKTNESKNKQ